MITLLILVAIGAVLLRASVRAKTTFILLMALSVVVSFFMAVHAISIISGIVITVFAELLVLWLDKNGILA